jgi:hypothetical protein
MRLVIQGDKHAEEVIGEPFEIEGSGHQFAVHPKLRGDDHFAPWSATHVETGHRVGFGDTVDEAIASARARWNQASTETIEAGLKRARKVCAERTLARAPSANPVNH